MLQTIIFFTAVLMGLAVSLHELALFASYDKKMRQNNKYLQGWKSQKN